MGPRRRPFLLLVVLAAFCVAPAGARGQMDEPNAAKTYRNIWESIDPGLWEAVSELRTGGAWRPERASAKLLAASGREVERLIDATRLAPGTMEADDADGWARELSDSRNYRRTAYLFGVDATRLLAEGKADEAAGRVAAIFRLAGQLAEEARRDATSAASACIQLGEEYVEQVCKAPSLTEGGRRTLAGAVVALDAEDPAGFKVWLEGMRRQMEWIAREFGGPDAGERLVESLPIPAERKRALAPGEQERFERRRGRGRRSWDMYPSRQLITDIRNMDGPAVQQAQREADRMFEAALELWDESDALDQLEILDAGAARNAFGPLVRLSPANLSRQRRAADRVNESMEHIRLLIIAR